MYDDGTIFFFLLSLIGNLIRIVTILISFLYFKL
jgi:hypothetical protein